MQGDIVSVCNIHLAPCLLIYLLELVAKNLETLLSIAYISLHLTSHFPFPPTTFPCYLDHTCLKNTTTKLNWRGGIFQEMSPCIVTWANIYYRAMRVFWK